MHHACFSLPESSMIFFNSSTARDKKMTKKLNLKFAKYHKKKKSQPNYHILTKPVGCRVTWEAV